MLWGTKLNIATNDGENKAYQNTSRILQDIWKIEASGSKESLFESKAVKMECFN